MALTISEANAIQTKYFDPTISQEVYEESPFYYKLKKAGNVTTSGGNSIQWPIRYKEHGQAKAVDPDDQISYKSIPTRTGADIDWKYLTSPTMMSWDEKVKNSGKEKIIDLLSEKAKEMNEDMFELFADQLFATTQGDKAIASLETIIDSSTSYGGISPTDATVWASTEDSTTTVLVLYGENSLSYMINQATFGKKTPDLHITTRDLFSKFESLLEPQTRYEDKTMADGGFTNLTFHSKPIVSDVHCASGRWYGICSKDMEIRYHKDYDFSKTGWFDLKQAGFPHHVANVVSWVGNIMCRSRQTQFKFTALDYTL